MIPKSNQRPFACVVLRFACYKSVIVVGHIFDVNGWKLKGLSVHDASYSYLIARSKDLLYSYFPVIFFSLK